MRPSLTVSEKGLEIVKLFVFFEALDSSSVDLRLLGAGPVATTDWPPARFDKPDRLDASLAWEQLFRGEGLALRFVEWRVPRVEDWREPRVEEWPAPRVVGWRCLRVAKCRRGFSFISSLN